MLPAKLPMPARLSLATLLAVSLWGCPSATTGAGNRPQGWSDKDERIPWYKGTQGSRIMPMSWFMALEQPDAQAAFSDIGYLEQFGYLRADSALGLTLPIGFAADRQDDSKLTFSKLRWLPNQKPQGAKSKDASGDWVGLTCAACHTGRYTHGGAVHTVDGAPGMGDYQRFVEAMNLSLRRTLDQPARFARFADKVLAGHEAATADAATKQANRTRLRGELAKLMAWQEETERLNKTDVRYGFARVDAFGRIYNKVLQFNGAQQKGNPSNAPVSYPFLWNLEYQSRVQWNGAVPNKAVKLAGRKFYADAIGRNTGEVLGVFGDVVITPMEERKGKLTGFHSSVNIDNLDRLEGVLRKLQSPVWPSDLPPIDTALAEKGDKLFDQKCASCHTPREQWKAKAETGVEVMEPLNKMAAEGNLTDIWMACNAVIFAGPTGKLKGTPDGFIKGTPLDVQALVIAQLSATVKGTLLGEKGELIGRAFSSFFGINRTPIVFESPPDLETVTPEQELKRDFCMKTPASNELPLWYKARPLDGIWATAPYLHNGSVPTLYHLLLAPNDRPKEFWVGSFAYDPKHVGYDWQDDLGGKAFRYVAKDAEGFMIDGNSNAGHDYGASGLSEADRWALVEYMKTL